MSTSSPGWVLAFDGSCGSCAGVADAVAAACGERIQVRPLQNDEVGAWRRTALGPDPQWRPVLLRIAGNGEVSAWTGVRMAARLVRHLGLPASLDILRALGQLRAMNHRGQVRRPGDVAPLVGISRKRFLRNVGLGAATVVGILASGAVPAAADTVQSWERKNEGSLPTTLPELAALPIAFRRAAYRHLTAEQRSAVWTAHLDGFAARIAAAGPTQQRVYAQARDFAADPAHFRAPDDAILQELAAATIAAFGREQATAMIAVLGPNDEAPDAVTAAAPGCTCSNRSDYCPGSSTCRGGAQGCVQSGGCGTFYAYTCNGLCS